MKQDTTDSQSTQNGLCSTSQQQCFASSQESATPHTVGRVLISRRPASDTFSRETRNTAEGEYHSTCALLQEKPTHSPEELERFRSNLSQWTEAQWQALQSLADKNTRGEELMKIFGFKRRKDLESVFYKLSKHFQKFYSIPWDTDYENGEHSLPSLKMGKDGLRISNTRFRRHGISVPPNSYFELKKISDSIIQLTLIT